MNIFAVHKDPRLAAQALCDKHINKMLLESCQMLCSVFPEGVAPYKRTHYNHPCTVWVRTSIQNWYWLLDHAKALSAEAKYRYGDKPLACDRILEWLDRNTPELPQTSLTPFALCMPDQYKNQHDPVGAYRDFYRHEKQSFAKWNKTRPQPDWWLSN